MSWTKKAIKTFSYLSYLSIVVLLLLEVVFRVLPTSDSFYLQAVTHEEPITRFEENRELTKQIGFDFSHVTSKHINNFGFATDRDFVLSESDSNLIFAVIGDSYVEAMQIKNKDTFHAKLDANLKNVVVYPFGVSGSPLSQYLAFADYAKKNFKPDFFIFLIISNDFDESWYEIKQAPGFHYFNPDGSLKLIEYIPSRIREIARKSAFIRYLILDLKIQVQLSRFFTALKNKSNIFNFHNKNYRLGDKEVEHFVSGLQQNDKLGHEAIEHFVSGLQQNDKLGHEAIEHFVSGLQQFSAESKVIILLDGDRQAIYRGELERTPGATITSWYEKIAEMSGEQPELYVLDLHPIFQKDWSINREKFNFEYDFHWNEYGHRLAADALHELVTKLRY